uniref:Uncharacterized protein n=1 Tax=Romanomermis culicivorax TaxID=13658 RepID=A0A915J3G7_ROMCU
MGSTTKENPSLPGRRYKRPCYGRCIDCSEHSFWMACSNGWCNFFGCSCDGGYSKDLCSTTIGCKVSNTWCDLFDDILEP